MLVWGHIGFSFTFIFIITVTYTIFSRIKVPKGTSNPIKHTIDNNDIVNSSLQIIEPKLFLIAIFLPDIVDKIFSQLTLHSGRAVGHTLFFLAVVSIMTFALTENKKLTRTIFLGDLFHLILDSGGYVPWLWPFLPLLFPKSEPWTIEKLVYIYLHSPPWYEVVGFLLTIGTLLVYQKNLKAFAIRQYYYLTEKKVF